MLDDSTQAVLEEYLEDLQAGKHPDRAALVLRHPELAEALECLEGLEKMAPALGEDRVGDDQATLPVARPTATDAPWTDITPKPSMDFGKYVIECELGRGGMGVVFKARQKDLDRLVALKMILSNHLASSDSVHRFQDEARAAACLHHPNIVAIYEAGQIEGQPFFAMQFISGPSLAQRLRKERLDPETSARIVLSIAHAVDHLHRHNIIHRDLKPSNILLDEAGQPYVTDFGLVKMLVGESHRTSTGVIVGTPSYMSPEQAAGKGGRVGPLSDIYSLGAVLYEMLTGRPPFAEGTPLDTLVQVLEGEPVPPRLLNPHVPPDLEMICLRCLEKPPEDRYPSAAILAEDLARFLKGEDIEFKRQRLVHRVQRWIRREPALVSRLITLGMCLALAQFTYHFFHTVPLSLHLKVMGILSLWGFLSVVCQQLMHRERWAGVVRYVWSALDVILFGGVLYVDEALVSPVAVGFPLLIAASGLWFRVPLVWFTTFMVELSYAMLLWEHVIRMQSVEGLHKHAMCIIALAVLGFIIAYQVNRVRALSRFYESRPLP